MAWVVPEFDAPSINRAGKALVLAMNSAWEQWGRQEWDEYRSHLVVINNWRSSHAYPLNTLQVNLRGIARRIGTKAVVAQRIKRLSSIGHKLDRFPSMKLTQMQDLGGCRGIFPTVSHVREARDYYLHVSGIKHERVSVDDYVESPKSSGYRGVHLVYRYFSDKDKAHYNGLKVEVQLRSRYQHAWATAVETVGTFSGEALKSSLGSERWQRFFALMSSLISLRERAAVVPGTSSDRAELVSELRDLAEELQVAHRLREYGNALKSITDPAARTNAAKFYLLELDAAAGTLQITGFDQHEREAAEERYEQVELLRQGAPHTDAVLVSVESITALSKAYPNYFADTRLFVELMNQALLGRARSIVVPDRQLDVLVAD